jgi:DNA-binding Lrp family transcriptional regulator
MTAADLAAAGAGELPSTQSTPPLNKDIPMNAPSWRERFAELGIRIHPAAERLPPMTEHELAEQGNDIVKNGLRYPIVLFCERIKRGRDDYPRHDELVLLDGRNRLTAMEKAGIRLFEGDRFAPGVLIDGVRNPVEILWRDVGNGEVCDPVDYIVSANIHRRHLGVEEKEKIAADVLKERPERSNREVAKMVKLSHPKIAKIRSKLEMTGDVETVSTRTDSKGRQQPARKPAKPPSNEALREEQASAQRAPPGAPTASASTPPHAFRVAEAPRHLSDGQDVGRVQSAILNAYLALKAVDNADLQAVRKGLNADQIAQAIEHIDASLGRLHKLHAALRGLQ